MRFLFFQTNNTFFHHHHYCTAVYCNPSSLLHCTCRSPPGTEIATYSDLGRIRDELSAQCTADKAALEGRITTLEQKLQREHELTKDADAKAQKERAELKVGLDKVLDDIVSLSSTVNNLATPDVDDQTECENLPVSIDGGTVAGEGVLPGSLRLYTCKSGFKLVGAGIVICHSDGAWSSAAPACIAASTTSTQTTTTVTTITATTTTDGNEPTYTPPPNHSVGQNSPILLDIVCALPLRRRCPAVSARCGPSRLNFMLIRAILMNLHPFLVQLKVHQSPRRLLVQRPCARGPF